MTIQLPACERAINAVAAVDINDPAVVPDTLANTWLGIDLSILGFCSENLPKASPDSIAERVNMGKISAAVNAAHAGGIDFVSFASTFRTRSDNRCRNAALDGATCGASLAEAAKGGVVVEIAPDLADQALDLLAEQNEGWAGISVSFADADDARDFIPLFRAARAAGVTTTVRLDGAPIDAELVQIIAEHADFVRVSLADPHAAREIRFAIRSAARDAGREVPVVADLCIVISATTQAAEERAELIGAMSGCELFAGRAKAIGTVYDVADAIETWVGLGAADGFVLIPASLPTDLASVTRGVLPLLRARTEIR